MVARQRSCLDDCLDFHRLSPLSKLLRFFPLFLNMERALFASDRWQEAADLVERALEANGDDYNVYIPYGNALAALGRTEATRTLIERALTVLEQQIE